MATKTDRLLRNTLLGGLILGLFALVAGLLVATTYENTKDRIKENERQSILRALHSLIPPERHDNDIYADMITVQAAGLGYRGGLAKIYRARMGEVPVAAILEVIAPDGYGGPIKLLVAVNFDGRLAGVRVVSHAETPGLGDGIEEEKSNWIHQFDDRSLINTPPRLWAVKKDGGVFDQFTGATITPRAVVKAVYKALNYYELYLEQIFTAPSEPHE